MDSSSEGSFAWTDASNDSTDIENMAKTNINITQSGEESESGKSYKKKLQRHLFLGSGDESSLEVSEGNRRRKRKLSQHSEADNIQSPKKKQVKAESDSDTDRPRKKKKSSERKTQDSSNDMYDESFLNSKVKSEQSFALPSPVKGKKNKKSAANAKETISNGDMEESEELSLSNPKGISNSTIRHEDSTPGSGHEGENDENKYHLVNTKTSKRKSSKKSNNIVVEVQNIATEDGLQADETAITERHKSVSADEQSDSASDTHTHTQHNISADKSSRLSQETILNNRTLNDNVNSERRHSESLFIKRKSRMSERIQFEEEYDSDIQTKQIITNTSTKSTESTKLTGFIEESSISLRPFQVKIPSTQILTDQDDVWLVRCPKDIKPEAFQDKKWALDDKYKIKLDGQTYEGNIDDTDSNMTILTCVHDKAVVKNVKINGCIRLRRRLPKAHVQEDNIMVNNQTNFIPLPETKCRHPLFGLHYKKAIKLPSSVAERLRATPAPRAAGKRKAKRERETPARPGGGAPAAPKAEPADLTQHIAAKKKKKKRKHSEAAEDEPAPRRRPERDLASAEAWDSEKAIEENLFNF